jgi:YidC/Oxa1 family membrane protein insertase
MIEIFNLFFYQPLLNLLVFIYNILPNHDLGLAIIILTIFIRMILWPISLKAIKAQKSLQAIQPKIKEIQQKYKNDKEKLASELIRLYREYKVNPFTSLILVFIQLPILIAVYQVFLKGLKGEKLILYPFIHNPLSLNPISFGILDLSKPNFVLAIITTFVQYLQTKYLGFKKTKSIKEDQSKQEQMISILNKQMAGMMLFFTFLIGITLPAGCLLYWLISLLFTILQQKLFKYDKHS